MPIKLEIDRAMFLWQAKHNQRLTYAELAEKVGISLATLNRMKNGDMTNPDLRKINLLCKVLECDLPQLLVRYPTAMLNESSLQSKENNTERKELEEFLTRKSGAEQETPKINTAFLHRRR